MHFKRHKPKTDKGINWSTPKFIQAEKDPANSRPNHTWRKKYECHKRKGPHDFVLVKEEDAWIFHWKNFVCTACGKKKYEYKEKDTVPEKDTQLSQEG